MDRQIDRSFMRTAQHGHLGWCVTTYAMLAVTLVGCGRSGPPRVVISGTVTYQGRMIPEGEIGFIPTDGATGPTLNVPIVDGLYKMDKLGGVPTGTYRVRIVAAHGRAHSGKENVPGFRLVQYIPAKYNTKSQLKINIDADSGFTNRDFLLDD